MNNINSITFSPLKNSQFLKPQKMHYVQNGVSKFWELVKIHDSVSILLYNITRKVLVVVKQFRPAVYCADIPEKDCLGTVDTNKYLVDQACTLELCAGIIDKNKSLEEIAQEEVLEECGYQIPISSLKKIMTYRSSIGVTGDRQTIFYAEIEDNMRVSGGGGNPEEGELIEVVELSIADAKKYLESGDVLSPGGFIFALLWFFQNKDAL